MSDRKDKSIRPVVAQEVAQDKGRSDIVTGPGLYVLRNGKFVAINRTIHRMAIACGEVWGLDGSAPPTSCDNSERDIIRRATPEEAVRFCGGGE